MATDQQAPARLWVAAIDTDDPAGLAQFYAEVLGWEVADSDDTSVTVVWPDFAELSFQFAINHRPPSWPDPEIPQQLHLDFGVADLSASVERAERLGARRAGVPAGRTFVTLVDPSGHPFCLCLDPSKRGTP